MSNRLRTGIWLGVALLLGLCSLFLGLTIRQERADDLAHAADMSRAVAISLEGQATATLRDVTNGLYSAVNAVSADGGLPLMTPQGLAYMLRREFTDTAVLADIVVLDAKGDIYTHIAQAPLAPANYAQSSSIRHFSSNPGDNRPYLSTPFTSPTFKRWLLPVVVPLRGYDGHLEGVIAALVDLDYFQKFYAGLGGRQHWQYTITTTDGRLLTHSPPQALAADAPPVPGTRFVPDPARTPRPRESLSFQAANPLDGSPFLYAARAFSTQPLVMYVGVDIDKTLAQWRARAMEKLIMLLVLAAVLMLATILLLRALKRSASDSEIVTAMFRAAGDSIFISQGGRILACNPAAVRAYGASSEADLIGRQPREFWPPRQPDGQLSLEKAARMYDRALYPDGNSFEWLTQRLDGSTFMSEVHLTSFTIDGEVYFFGITRDITERKQAENQIRLLNQDLESRVLSRTEQLAGAKRELEVANEELRAFSYTIAHDIRAPVRHVLGFADMALTDSRPGSMSDDVRACIERIVGASTRMNEMIESLLALGRVGQKTLADTEFDLADLARTIIASLRERQPQRRASVTIQPGMRVRADPTLMHLVLENLLSNAWKFTGKKDQAQIEFGPGSDAAGYHFYIRDNGAGFDARYATRMFEPFSRMHPREEFEGTGVGLATVRRILTRHGGSIRAESAPGAGATFYFTLGNRDARVYGHSTAPA